MTRRGLFNKERAAARWEPLRERITEMYGRPEASQKDVAEALGISQSGLGRILQRLGIKAKGHGRSGELSGRFKHGKCARPYRKAVEKRECARCAGHVHLGIYRINRDASDNRPENLVVLCRSCHLSTSMRERWRAKKEGRATPKGTCLCSWKPEHHAKWKSKKPRKAKRRRVSKGVGE